MTTAIQALALLAGIGAGMGGALAACSGASTSGDAAPATPADPGAGSCTLCVTDGDCAGGVCAQFGSDSYCATACAVGSCATGSGCEPVTTVDGTQTNACVPLAQACGESVGPDGGRPDAAMALDTGAPVKGTVGASGGTLSRLLFAVVGDTRPPVINDTKGYPTAVITKIYSDIQAAAIPFAVSTGDYLFSTANGTQAAPQVDLYLKARAGYAGTVFPAMGNHECTGGVTSNCGPGTVDGITNNYSVFMSKMLAPLGKTNPNYAIDVDSPDRSWTSKFVFVAGNAWGSADATWFEGVLAKPTTYTFIIRHEPKAASTAPGCKGSEAIMARYPYTLAIVGHTHTYGKTGARQVTIGNGGAPLTGAANFGYGLIQQRTDGAIAVDMIDYQSGGADGSFRFALKADGSPAP